MGRMIDHRRLKVLVQPTDPPDDQPAEPETGVASVSVDTFCPVCHWGLRVTVEPVEVVS
jgi:rubredoxin